VKEIVWPNNKIMVEICLHRKVILESEALRESNATVHRDMWWKYEID
jgi:hypothetical protein